MKKVIRRILLVVGLALIVALIWNWSLVVYGVGQGIGQMKIVMNARPVEEFLADPNFPDSLKSKLRLIDEIRKYAIDSLGLKDTKNYKTLYDQQGKELMWVVTASAPFKLEPKMWHFPIVGSVPYKGYFDIDKARKEKDKLLAEGYDVSVRNPGGWSTLGWFTDPILSKMLNRNEGDLASLIIHEMVHATVFVKDSIDFNENLASFIGDTASYYFLASKYGRESKEYIKYVHEDQNYQTYSDHILRGSAGLDSLYKTFTEQEPDSIKKEKKKAFIQKIISSLDTLTLYDVKKPSARFAGGLPNNAYFMSFRHYQSKQHIFTDELDLKFRGDIKKYIHYLSEKYPFL